MPSLQAFAETTLPAINASLNGLSAVFVAAGLVFIRRGEKNAHRACMLAAVASSTLFLACYLLRASLTGTHRFEGPHALKIAYLVILFSHMALAVVIVPLVGRTVWLALRGDLERHKKIARWTYPIWLYVSVTGVVIYVLLYHVSQPGV